MTVVIYILIAALVIIGCNVVILAALIVSGRISQAERDAGLDE